MQDITVNDSLSLECADKALKLARENEVLLHIIEKNLNRIEQLTSADTSPREFEDFQCKAVDLTNSLRACIEEFTGVKA